MTRVALLAAAALMAVSACTTGPDDPGTVPPPEPSVERTPGASALVGLPSGRAPRVPYVQGNRYLTAPDTGTVLPGSRGVSGVVPFSGGLLVADAVYFEGTNGVSLVRDGRRTGAWPSARHCSSGTPVAAEGGGYVAWVTVRCPESLDRTVGAVHRARADGSDEIKQPVGAGLVSVVGFLGRRVVYNAGFQDGAWIADFNGEPARIPGVDRVVDVSPKTGWLIGQRGDRARLVVDAGGRVRWRTDEGDLAAFSPDGTRVLALGRDRITVLRARDGVATAQVDLPDGADVWSTVWETNRTLLTVMRDARKVAVVRLHLDGRVERATTPIRAGGGLPPIVLLDPEPSRFRDGVRVAVPSHCGVRGVTVGGRLWLADPPLGRHNPPAGWGENETWGYFVETGPGRGRFVGDGGQRASFRRAALGSVDPNAGCE